MLLSTRKKRTPAGVFRSKTTPPPWDPTVALCLGAYGDPRGAGVSYERGTPAGLGALTAGYQENWGGLG